MKRFIAVLLVLVTLSCEDVIDLDLTQAPPKLVIDGSINWFKGTAGNEQKIKLTLSAPYFNSEIPPANGALITITDTSDNVFDFVEDGSSGIYRNNSFMPIINETYTLTIEYQDEFYIASEILKSVSSIEYIEQENDGGFSGDEIEIKAYYTDPENEKNFYFFEFLSEVYAIPSLEVYKDEFTNGNRIFGYYSEEDISQGDELVIRNYGISERFYEFMFILLQQNSDDSGGPFETQPATVRGNCINQTNPENFPLGYFRLSEVDEYVYIVK